MYQVQLYDAYGHDVTFDRLGIAAPDESDPLTLLCNTETLIEQETKRTPSFRELCDFLDL